MTHRLPWHRCLDHRREGALIDETGGVVSSAITASAPVHAQAPWSEQDPHDCGKEFVASIRQALADAGVG